MQLLSSNPPSIRRHIARHGHHEHTIVFEKRKEEVVFEKRKEEVRSKTGTCFF